MNTQRRRAHSFLVALSWAATAAWVLVYSPLALRSVLHEGAGGLGSILLIALILVAPAVVMGYLSFTLGRRTRGLSVFQVVGIVILLFLLGICVYGLSRSASANLDLLLPSVCLGVDLAAVGAAKMLPKDTGETA